MKEIFETTKCLSFDQIKLYVQGKLNSKEQYKVEEHLSDCELCSDAVDGYVSSENLEKSQAFLEKTTWPRKEETPKPAPAKIIQLPDTKSKKFPFLKIAAMLVGIIGSIAVFSYLNGDSGSYDMLIASSLPVYDQSSRNDSALVASEPFYKALQLFDRKQFTDAAAMFSQHLSSKPEDKAAIFFKGVALLKSGKTNEAIKHLEQVYLDRASGFHLDATWFLALAKLKKGKKTRAKSLLMTLAQTGNYYNKKASEILITL